MSIEVTFSAEIKLMEEELRLTQEDLKRLQDQFEQFDLQTKNLRESLKRLRDTELGKTNTSARPRSSKLQPLEVNEETNRPSRGARRKQVLNICKHLGRAGKEFKTIEVLRELTAIEGELTAGMKSYTYAVLTNLEDSDVLEKVNRGTWKLK